MLIKECCKNQYALGMYQGYNKYMEANFIYRQLEIYGIDFQTANSQQFLNVAISQRMIIKFHVKFKETFYLSTHFKTLIVSFSIDKKFSRNHII